MSQCHYERRHTDKNCVFALLSCVIIFSTVFFIGFVNIYSTSNFNQNDSFDDTYNYNDLYSFGNTTYNSTNNTSNSTIMYNNNSLIYDTQSKYNIMTHPITIIYIIGILLCLSCCICICI